MNNSRRKHVSLIFTLTLLLVLIPVLYAAGEEGGRKLINVTTETKGDVGVLANMGLDIWEVQQDSIVAAVTEEEIIEIKEHGFAFRIVIEDVDEYANTLSAKGGLRRPSSEPYYHSYGEIIAGLVALEASGIAQTHIIGSSVEARDIWAVKISDNPSESEQEPGVLFLGCHHAREWISVEVPFYLAQYLVNDYNTNPEIERLVDGCEIWIVPVVNPDGYEYSRTIERLWRKNRRNNGDGSFGVDLNRNYSYMWAGPGSSGNPSSETYRGPYAFSEPETQAVRDLVLGSDFRAILSYHSYGQLILHPWGYTKDPAPDACPMSTMAARMENFIEDTHSETYRSQQSSYLYLTSGDTTDWGYGHLGIPSFTIELRPKTYNPGFLLPPDQITPTSEENLPAALYLIGRTWWSDLNADSKVDYTDLGVFCPHWLETTCILPDWCAGADLDHGGQVNFADFSIFAENWLSEVVPPGEVEFYEDFETGDFSRHNWQHGGHASWTVVSDVVHEGVYSAKSGDISRNQESTLEITLDVSASKIRFYRKVSSEADYDFLRFYIDDVMQGEWSGEVDCWVPQTYTITSGQHTFKWAYEKDGSVDEGSDCARIDEISLY